MFYCDYVSHRRTVPEVLCKSVLCREVLNNPHITNIQGVTKGPKHKENESISLMAFRFTMATWSGLRDLQIKACMVLSVGAHEVQGVLYPVNIQHKHHLKEHIQYATACLTPDMLTWVHYKREWRYKEITKDKSEFPLCMLIYCTSFNFTSFLLYILHTESFWTIHWTNGLMRWFSVSSVNKTWCPIRVHLQPETHVPSFFILRAMKGMNSCATSNYW